jgi:hypothetical protein
MERSSTMQSNLQMHKTLSRVLPSQAQMQLDVIEWVNVADSQDVIAQMVDYRAGYGISNRVIVYCVILAKSMKYALRSSLFVSRITP